MMAQLIVPWRHLSLQLTLKDILKMNFVLMPNF